MYERVTINVGSCLLFEYSTDDYLHNYNNKSFAVIENSLVCIIYNNNVSYAKAVNLNDGLGQCIPF